MPIEVSTPVALDRERRAREVDQANIKLAELQRLYRESPEMKIQRDRGELERMQNDPYHVNKVVGGSFAAQNEEAMLAAKIRDAESRQEAERLDVQMGKKPAPEGTTAEVSFGDQIPRKDHAAAVATLVEHGVRPEMVETFLRTGHGDDAGGVEAEWAGAAEWERRLMNDPEKQKKFLARDPEVMKQFDYFGMYRRDRRREPSD